MEVALYDTEDNLVKTCGVLAVSDSVNHEGQIYSFTCSAIGKYLLLNKSGAGTIRILEIVVTSRGLLQFIDESVAFNRCYMAVVYFVTNR